MSATSNEARSVSAARIRELEAEVARLTKERDEALAGQTKWADAVRIDIEVSDLRARMAEDGLRLAKIEAASLRARVEVLEKALRGVGDEDGCFCRRHAMMDPIGYHEPECAAARAALKAEGAAGPTGESP